MRSAKSPKPKTGQRIARYPRFGALLKQTRRATIYAGKSMTEERAGDLSGLGRNVINSLEAGKTFATPRHLRGLETAYGVPVQTLWTALWEEMGPDEREVCTMGPPIAQVTPTVTEKQKSEGEGVAKPHALTYDAQAHKQQSYLISLGAQGEKEVHPGGSGSTPNYSIGVFEIPEDPVKYGQQLLVKLAAALDIKALVELRNEVTRLGTALFNGSAVIAGQDSVPLAAQTGTRGAAPRTPRRPHRKPPRDAS